MFECRHCSTINPVGAVHCVKCGEKLNFDKKVETKKVLDEHCFTKEEWPRVIKKSIVALLLTAFALVVGGYACPILTNPKIDDTAGEIALKRFKKLTVRAGLKDSFTEKELAYIVKKELSRTFSTLPSGISDVTPKDLSIDFIDETTLSATVSYQSLKGYFPLFCTYEISISPDKNQRCEIDLTSIKLGLLPLSGKIAAKFKEEMSGGIYGSSLQNLLPRLKGITISDGKITIDVI